MWSGDLINRAHDLVLATDSTHGVEHEIELLIRVGCHAARAQTAASLGNGGRHHWIGENACLETDDFEKEEVSLMHGVEPNPRTALDSVRN